MTPAGLLDRHGHVVFDVAGREQRELDDRNGVDCVSQSVDSVVDGWLGEFEEGGINWNLQAVFEHHRQLPDLLVGFLAARAVADQQDGLVVDRIDGVVKLAHGYSVASNCERSNSTSVAWSRLWISFRRRLGAKRPVSPVSS